MSKTFVESLRQLDQELQEHSLSPQMDHEIRKQLREPIVSDLRRVHPMWLATGFACLALLVGVVTHSLMTPLSHNIGGFLVVDGAVKLAKQNAVRCQSSQCNLKFVERRTSLKLQQKAQVRRHKKHLQLFRGSTYFHVQPRRPGQSALRVYVSHGYVEVIGTQFTLWQHPNKGKLLLHEGKVRFVQNDGQTKHVVAGQTLHWPLSSKTKPSKPLPQRVSPVPVPRRVKPKAPNRRQPKIVRPRLRVTKRATSPTPRKKSAPLTRSVVAPRTVEPKVRLQPRQPSTPPPVRLDAGSLRVMKEANQLRVRQKYKQAIRLLRNHIKTLGPQRAAIHEVLYYEVGVFLTDYLKNSKQACRHWFNHRSKFPHSVRYQQEIKDYIQLLHCKR